MWEEDKRGHLASDSTSTPEDVVYLSTIHFLKGYLNLKAVHGKTSFGKMELNRDSH